MKLIRDRNIHWKGAKKREVLSATLRQTERSLEEDARDVAGGRKGQSSDRGD